MSIPTNTPLGPEQLGALAKEVRGSDSQSKAAERIGVTQSQVSQAESGASRYVSTAIKLIETYTGRTVEGPVYVIR